MRKALAIGSWMLAISKNIANNQLLIANKAFCFELLANGYNVKKVVKKKPEMIQAL